MIALERGERGYMDRYTGNSFLSSSYAYFTGACGRIFHKDLGLNFIVKLRS